MASKQFLTKRVAEGFTKNMIGNFCEPVSLEAYRKMIKFRCNNLGMKELDLSVGKWAVIHAKNLSLADCRQFESEVLDLETPDLWELVIKKDVQESLAEHRKLKFIQEVRKFVDKGAVAL